MGDVAFSPRGLLSPVPAADLNRRCPASKKRKRVNEEKVSHLQPFIATLLPAVHGKSSHTLVPVAKLDRSQLRLAHLDFTPVKAALPTGCPFHAKIALFDDQFPPNDHLLLLARLAPNGGYYVIEKLDDDIYMPCRLRVQSNDCFSKAIAANGRENSDLAKLPEFENQFPVSTLIHPVAGEAAKLQLEPPEPKRPKNRKGVWARLSILPKAESRQMPAQQQEHGLPQWKQDATSECQETAHAHDDDDIQRASCLPAADLAQPGLGEEQQPLHPVNTAGEPKATPDTFRSVDDLLLSVQEVLLKTLYTTKTPLAHFTKSTLARARAAFRSSATTTTSELCDFYRERIISSKRMDQKYRDAIPRVINDSILSQEGGDGGGANIAKRNSKKSGKKRKFQKNGLYRGEEQYVRTWWLGRGGGKHEMAAVYSREREIQEHLRALRNREIHLQMILILEILALESNSDADRKQEATSVSLKQEPEEDGVKSAVTEKSSVGKKKRRDLILDLDILVDRLCIYESVVDDPLATDETNVETAGPRLNVKDQLRDFCCDVIIPFYSHKIPIIVKDLSRKLGGPDMSPKRPKIPSRTTSSDGNKPGGAIDPRRCAVRHQTLKRVLSEDHTSRKPSPPALTRSATTPIGGMCMVGSMETSQRTSGRGSLHRSQSFTNREVDLVAHSKADEAKRRKLAGLAKQKEELSAAIHALKKPNRSLVGREIMAEAALRGAEAGPAGDGVRTGSASNQSRGVQISATPKKNMSLGADAAQRLVHEDTGTRTIAKRPAWQSGPTPHIAPAQHSSTADLAGPSQAQRAAPYPTVQSTPSRCSPHSFKSSNHFHPSVIQATPSTTRFHPSIIENTPLRMTRSLRPVSIQPLAETTDVAGDGDNVFRDAPMVPAQAGKAMERVMKKAWGGGGGGSKDLSSASSVSIYQSLGWDVDGVDDDLDELL